MVNWQMEGNRALTKGKPNAGAAADDEPRDRARVDAVILDLDGVIVESEAVWERVRSRFVEAHGGRWLGDSHRHMMGMSTAAWVAYLTADLGVALPAREVASRVIAKMRDDYSEHLPLVTGAVAAIGGLSRHWKLAVASGSPMSLIDAVLEGAGIRELFGAIVSSDEVDSGKPAPDVYLEAAARLGVRPDVCVVVEDSANGIKSGVAAGARVIAIPNHQYPPDTQSLELAGLILRDIALLTPDAVRQVNHPRAPG